MSTAGQHAPYTRPAHRWWIIAAILALAVLIGALHGRSLSYGLFMDDHAHYRQLRECGWSLGELTRAGHLELVGGVIELWWMPDCTLRFFRPLAFGLMKLTYALSGWSPTVMHVTSLGWHLVACTLLMLLLRRLGAGRGLAWAVATLFAIHPGHVATVQWIASQTELMVTTLLLAALLCYAEFRQWPGPAQAIASGRSAQGRWGWGVACAGLFAIAIGCRENAIMFPLVALATEPLLSRQRSWAKLMLFAGFGIAIGVYLGLRWHYLGGAALPPRPYVVPPSDPDFLHYILDKGCYYLLGEFLLVPCVPIGGMAYFAQRPLVFYGLALLIVAVLLLLIFKHRRRIAGRLGPACLLGFMVPVLPAFESPHHLYLPGVGWAIMAMLLLEEIGGVGAGTRKRVAEWRRRVMWLIVSATGLVLALTTHFFAFALNTAQAVEDLVIEEIAAAPRPVADGDTLYIANLPVIAHYVKLGVEERTGTHDLRVVALTWSPRLLGMATPCERKPIDRRTFDVCVVEDRYFSGPLRLLIEQAGGGRLPWSDGQLVRHEGFTAQVLEDEDGVSTLRFAFDQDLAQTGVHLFWGSETRKAYQVRP
jgi:hypothetical protein